jgi:hypothetical protein
MTKTPLLAGSLLLGAAGGFAASLLSGASDTAPPATSTAAGRAPDLAAEIERIERRLDALAAARATLPRAAPTAAAADLGAGVTATDPADPVPVRIAALEARIAALEKRGAGQPGPVVPDDLTGVPSKELDALARTLVQSKRHAEARRVLEHLLARGDLDDAQRTDMEMQLGWALRGSGLFAESEARFLETQRRVGEDSESGAWAGFQAAWDRHYLKDHAAASLRMERSAGAAGVSPIVRVHSLYNAAYFAKEAGDPARARGLLERLLNDHAKDIPASQTHMKTQAEAWLAEVRGF